MGDTRTIEIGDQVRELLRTECDDEIHQALVLGRVIGYLMKHAKDQRRFELNLMALATVVREGKLDR